MKRLTDKTPEVSHEFQEKDEKGGFLFDVLEQSVEKKVIDN